MEDQMEYLDVLEPYEGECLFSWTIRMVIWYVGFGRVERFYEDAKRELFGNTTSFYPRLYFEANLSVLVERVDLPRSQYFRDVSTVLDKMTIFPLYAAFYNEKQYDEALKKRTEEIFDKSENIPALEGIGYYNQNTRKGYRYCPICMKEDGRYLKREHQVPGIDICYKHSVRLKTVPYKKNWKYLNFLDKSFENEPVERIANRREEILYELSKMIHCIFKNGFEETLDVTKAKIRKRLVEEGYLSEKNYYYDFNQIYNDFEFEFYFPSLQNSVDVLLNCIFATRKNKAYNPLDYLFLIFQLFGPLEVFHDFSVNEKDIRTAQYYTKMQPKLYLEAETGKRYLTTIEYAAKYGKKRSQIRNYCSNGNLIGAVQRNKIWLIPENTPYPRDHRYKKGIKNAEEHFYISK